MRELLDIVGALCMATVSVWIIRHVCVAIDGYLARRRAWREWEQRELFRNVKFDRDGVGHG